MTVIPLGVYVLPGRVRDAVDVVTQAQDAERLGFDKIWLGERYDLKEGGVLCGAMAASTRRIGIGTGLVGASARHPVMTAALAASAQSVSRGRFVLGLGQGVAELNVGHGLPNHRFDGFADYCRIVRQLLAGETVRYSGVLGDFPAARLVDPIPGALPEFVLGSWFAPQRAAALAAEVFDGVLLGPMLTAEAVGAAVHRLHGACRQRGRDPATLKVYATVVTAPALSELDTLAVVNARMVTYLHFPAIGRAVVEQNRWDLDLFDRLMGHEKFRAAKNTSVDQAFHRDALLDVAATLPPAWVAGANAVGSVAQCAAGVRDYMEAGADELVLHGASPVQNGALLAELRG